ncbi:hypothetical protein BH18ACT15_BH18ACT15_00900 [soil metagenome]
MADKDYAAKRSPERTPEPPAEVAGNVDVATAPPGSRFMIHQHHARRLHFDLRLEMMNGSTPVLVSWAVPKNLPLKKGKPHLAVHVEDHPFDYGSFSGSIPQGSYGAGEVRIFDSGTYELLEQETGKLTIRLLGRRIRGVYHLFRTAKSGQDDKDWLVRLRTDERPERDPFPELRPMLSSSAQHAFDDDQWLFEPKWDGVRALAACTDETLLISRSGRDISATYPELNRLNERLVALDAILDGEIAATVEGRPSFERLQARINLTEAREIERAVAKIPVSYFVFDLVYLDGKSLVSTPLRERKQLLDELVVPSQAVQVTTHVTGEGTALAHAARAQRLEGIVAKKLASPYRPGKRTREWLKIKEVHEADVVIGGWSPGEGAREWSFGALLVGAYDKSGLRFLGAVGTGFDESKLIELTALLAPLETTECPFAEGPAGMRAGGSGRSLRSPRWVRPELVARVEYREVTTAPRLRAPAFKGLRTDKGPLECLLEQLTPGGAMAPAT